MSRLTKKGKTYTIKWENLNKSINKLGQLEDLEDELGIDLIKLCKSFDSDIYIKVDERIMFVGYDHKEYNFPEGNIYCRFDDSNIGACISIDSYGKTWSLDKKELGNDK